MVPRPGFPGGPPYPVGPYGPYLPYRRPEPPVPSEKRKQVILVVLIASALALVGSMLTPLYYATGQPWSSGFFLWQWTPHLLGGDQTEAVVGVFVLYFITTLTSALLALLAAAGVLGKVPAVVWAIALGLDGLVSLFMLLILAAASAEPQVSGGPATWLNILGVALGLVALWTRKHRAVWMRDSTL